MTHKCPDPEALAAYIDGLLSGKEREEVERHLVDCDLCLEGIILSKTVEKERVFYQASQEVVDVIVRFLKHVVKIITKVNEIKVLPVPMPVSLRGKKGASRNIARFRKEFEEFTAEVEIERQDRNTGDIRIRIVRDDHPIDDVRVTFKGLSFLKTLIIGIDDRLVDIPWELAYDGQEFLCIRFKND